MKTFTLLAVCLFANFTATLYAQTLNLGNTVWWDLNDNAKKDVGEPAASGYTVKLYQDNNEDGVADAGFTTLITTTDVDGKFLFTNLAGGSYFVRVSAGYSHYKTTIYGGDPDNNIVGDNNGYSQNLSTFNIYTQTITLEPGTEPDGTGATNTNTNNTIDIGMWKGNGLGDFVWVDDNNDGLQQASEPGLPNVTVILKDAAGNVLETTTTDASGAYSFYDPSGKYGTTNYQIEFLTPAGYVPAFSNIGFDDANDSDPVNGVITGVTVPVGTWNHSFDAAFKPSGNGGVLPVKIINFQALLNNNKVDIKWITAEEMNVSHYVVEKSTNGINYVNTGIVFTKGNTLANATYSFVDDLNNNASDIIYYRLRSVDFDGKSQFSDIRIIRLTKQIEKNVTIVTYPNPVSNEVRITIPASWQNQKVVYEMYNAAGNTVKRIETAKSNQTETINLTTVATGFYIVKATCLGQTAQQKIIKN